MADENWQPAEKVQVNDAGEYRALIGGAWTPVTRAQKNDAGQYRVQVSAAPAAPQPASATPMQKVQASAPMRVVQGLREPIDAAAQMAANWMPESVTNALDYLPAKLRNSDSPLLQTIGERFFADPRAGATNQRMRGEEAQYQTARDATAGRDGAGADVARFVGNVLSPANAVIASRVPSLAGASLPRLAATGAAISGAGGALTPVTGDGDFGPQKAAQITLAAGTGAVLTPPLAKLTEAVAPRVAAFFQRNFAPEKLGAEASLRTDEALKAAFREIGADMDSVPKAYVAELRQQVLESLKQGRLPDIAAQIRKADFDALKIAPLRGQITRDPTQFARERNLRAMPNMGEPIMERLTAQNARLQDLVGGYGGPQATEAVTAGQKLGAALSARDKEMRGAVTAAYKEARKGGAREMDIALQPLYADMERIAKDYGKGNQAVQWAKEYFKDIGLFGGKQTKPIFSLEDAEQALQTINKNRSNEPAVNAAFSEMRAAIKKAITETPTVDDVFAPARNLAAQRFKAHDALPALAEAAEGRLSPDKFVARHIVNAETSSVRALADALRKSPEALAEAKNQVGAYLQRAAFGENLAGDKVLSPERLAKALRTVGTEKLKVFYTPAEVEQLQRIARTGAYINQWPASAPVMGNPNMTWAGPMLGRIPGAPAAFQMAAALGRTAKSGADVSAALSAKVPEGAAPMSPEAVRQLTQALALMGSGSGMAVAPR